MLCGSLMVSVIMLARFVPSCGQGNEVSTPAECPCEHGVCSISTHGNISCVCDSYWEGDLCDQEIDECTQNPCEDENAQCQNVHSGRECRCKSGFELGAGGHCVKTFMWMDYRNTTKWLPVSPDPDRVTFNTVVPDIPFPFFNFSSWFIHVTSHGYVRMGRLSYFEMGNQVDDVDPFVKTSWPALPFYLAPYWTKFGYNVDSDDSKVYISESFRAQSDTDISLLDYAGSVLAKVSPDFEPHGAFAFTWSNALPQQTLRGNETATVQLILTTDFVYTYAIINWRDVYSDADLAGGPVVVAGHSGPDGGFIPLEPKPGSQKVIPLFSTGTPTRAPRECAEKMAKSLQSVDYSAADQLRCPCMEFAAGWDFRLQVDESRITDTCHCYVALNSTGGTNTQCCYERRFFSSYLGCAHEVIEESLDDLEADREHIRDICCKLSSGWCGKYHRMFPESCTNNVTVKFAAANGYGSLHMHAFPGNAYSFIGWGEYVLVKNSIIEIQGRTQKRDTGNTTFFSAFALQPTFNASSYQIYLTSDGSLQHGWTDPSRRVDNREFIVYQEDEDQVQIGTLNFYLWVLRGAGDILDLDLRLPEDTVVVGLLGSDGQGKAVNASSVEEWRVTKNASLFDYMKPTQTTYEEVNEHAGFEPEYLPENSNEALEMIGIKERQEAEYWCGSDLFCLQEYYLFKNYEASASNALAGSIYMEQFVFYSNYKGLIFEDFKDDKFLPSKIANGFSLEVKVKSHSMDQVTFSIEGSLAELENVSMDGNIFRFPDSNLKELRALEYPQTLKFHARDQTTNVTFVYEPYLYLCLCEEDTQCIAEEVGYFFGNVRLVGCLCNSQSSQWPRVAGRFCEQDADVCSNCYNETACDPTKREDYCDATCPVHMEGNGFFCRDIDECHTDNHGCEHLCENTDSGAVCSCESGYRNDGSRCIDIDECAENLSICGSGKYCSNTPGSFECKCYGNSVGENCVASPYLYPGSATLTPVSGQRWTDIKDGENLELRSRTARSRPKGG